MNPQNNILDKVFSPLFFEKMQELFANKEKFDPRFIKLFTDLDFHICDAAEDENGNPDDTNIIQAVDNIIKFVGSTDIIKYIDMIISN